MRSDRSCYTPNGCMVFGVPAPCFVCLCVCVYIHMTTDNYINSYVCTHIHARPHCNGMRASQHSQSKRAPHTHTARWALCLIGILQWCHMKKFFEQRWNCVFAALQRTHTRTTMHNKRFVSVKEQFNRTHSAKLRFSYLSFYIARSITWSCTHSHFTYRVLKALFVIIINIISVLVRAGSNRWQLVCVWQIKLNSK